MRNAIERKGLISFRIVSGDNQFIDPYNTYVLVTSSIKNPQGGNIPARAADPHNPVCNMLPVNGLGTTWLKKIDVKLNGTTVSFDGNMSSHRADIENSMLYPVRMMYYSCGANVVDLSNFNALPCAQS